MKVLKMNKLIIECPCCGSVFEVEPEDIIAAGGFRYVKCPICKKSIDLNNIINKENETN